MSTALRWEVLSGVEDLELALSGPIDERCDLEALVAVIPAGRRIQLAMSEVHRVTSAGALRWSDFMAKLKRRNVQVALRNCAPCIVRQLNMSKQFQGHARVRSVYAPYYCLRCNEDQLRLIDLTAEVAAQIRAPLACRRCGAELSIDEEEALYTQLQT